MIKIFGLFMCMVGVTWEAIPIIVSLDDKHFITGILLVFLYIMLMGYPENFAILRLAVKIISMFVIIETVGIAVGIIWLMVEMILPLYVSHFLDS